MADFRFLRMAYGIKSASDVCQYYISNIIEGLDGVVNSQDDIIIWSETMEELKKRTIEVSSSIRKHGLKQNSEINADLINLNLFS